MLEKKDETKLIGKAKLEKWDFNIKIRGSGDLRTLQNTLVKCPAWQCNHTQFKISLLYIFFRKKDTTKIHFLTLSQLKCFLTEKCKKKRGKERATAILPLDSEEVAASVL